MGRRKGAQSTVEAAPLTSALEPPDWRLVAVHTPDLAWRDATLQPGTELRIGRDPGGPEHDSARVDDERMSRLHGRFLRTPLDELLYRDAGSKNGSFVNGRRVEDARLNLSDVLRLGDTLLIVGRQAPAPEDCNIPEIVGRSAMMDGLRQLIRRVAPSTLPALVMGDTGTGKELVARALHRLSRRAGRFVALNCAAVPDTLVETTLFGHKKGAYTHATSSEPGAFTKADRGTLFLDEIGEMALGAQAKLLRVLETGEVTPVGATNPTHVDVRVVSATNQILREAVRQGRFRADLFSRLNGVRIDTPSLAERPDDILPLFHRLYDGKDVAMDADFVEALLIHEWPMNVRELRQLAARLPVLHPSARRWTLDHLDPELADRVRHRQSTEPEVEPSAHPIPQTREELLELLEHCDGSVPRVAALVGRGRRQVYRWMKRFDVEHGTGRSDP